MYSFVKGNLSLGYYEMSPDSQQHRICLRRGSKVTTKAICPSARQLQLFRRHSTEKALSQLHAHYRQLSSLLFTLPTLRGMPVFVEDPSQLSKARLKSDLIAHNVALPPAHSRKGTYVDLHERHVHQNTHADFSSDEELEADDEVSKEAKILDPSSLTDDGLISALLQHGVKAGPVVASTRAVYERKLQNLLLSNGRGDVTDEANGADEAALYSDSEDDEEEEEEEEEQEKPVTEEVQTQTEPAEQTLQDTQELSSHSEDSVYPQCFLVSSRLRFCATKNSQPRYKRNPRNVLKSSQQSRSQIASGFSRASVIDQPSGLATASMSKQRSGLSNGSTPSFSIAQMVEEIESRTPCSPPAGASPEFNHSVVQSHWSRSNRPVVEKPLEDKYNSHDSQFYTPKAGAHEWTQKEPVEEPVQERFKELLADTPTGIYATRRRPIKGAAGRPVQYVYPDIPLSPTTLERQEVERRLVPLHIQILVFFIVAIIIYGIYVFMEDYSFNPLLALIDFLEPGLDSDETGTQAVEEFLEIE